EFGRVWKVKRVQQLAFAIDVERFCVAASISGPLNRDDVALPVCSVQSNLFVSASDNCVVTKRATEVVQRFAQRIAGTRIVEVRPEQGRQPVTPVQPAPPGDERR